MPLKIVHRYTREQIMRNPKTLYVFGDNLERTGYGGQAGEARDCPNAIGIPTLVSPRIPASRESFRKLRGVCRIQFLKLKWHLMWGGTVVWPQDGVGTGIANLKFHCPELLDYIEGQLSELKRKYYRGK